MIRNLTNTTAKRLLLYIAMALPLLIVANALAPDALTGELGSMPGVMQAMVMLAGGLSFYILARKPSFVRNR